MRVVRKQYLGTHRIHVHYMNTEADVAVYL